MKQITDAEIQSVLKKLDISDLGNVTIRQSVNIARELENRTGEKFVHLEFGVPGLDSCRLGVEAQKKALDDGCAAIYPPAVGLPELKRNGAKFIKAFVDVEVPPECLIPTVGSMQACYNLLLECSQMSPGRNAVVYLNPGFSSYYLQAKVLGVEARMLDIYDCRGAALEHSLEELLSDGKVCAIVYSSPNNPTWTNLTENELKIIGRLCTKYDVVALEDLAYLCMDFREDRSRPFLPPFQATVAHYTDNWALMVSSSKIFSYAGERIALAVISDKLYNREFPALRERFGRGRFGDNFAMTYVYVNTSSATHSAQVAFAGMLGAAADGLYDFVSNVKEYARRAAAVKEIFRRHGFYLVYDKDVDKDVSDGFFFTIGYSGKTGSELVVELLRCGICSISLVASKSTREGIRVCVSLMKDEESFRLLDERLGMFELLQAD